MSQRPYKGYVLRKLLIKFAHHLEQYDKLFPSELNAAEPHYRAMDGIALELVQRMEQGQRFQDRQAELVMRVNALEQRCQTLEASMRLLNIEI